MASPIQTPRPRVRTSFSGPILLITIGVLFLLGTMGILNIDSFGHWFAHYWPIVLIVWGVLKLIEHQQAQAEGFRSPGISGGGVFLIIMIIGLGIAATHASRVDWESMGDHFGFSDDDLFSHTKLFGESFTFNDEVSQSFPPTATLHVTNERGNINIQDSDNNQIRVVVSKRVHARNQQDADKYNLSTKPKLSASGSVVTIDANTQGAGDHGVSTDMTISVPRKASVEVSTRHGDISVLGRDGDADLSSAHGSVSAQDIKGKVTLNLDHSSARVSQIASDVAVRGHAEDVTLEDIGGSVRLDGEFMETLKLSKIAKPVSFKSSRTDMEFTKLDGDLNLDSGDLQAANISGPLRLSTRSKDIRLSGMSGDVRLTNENGTVELHVNKLGSMQVDNRQGDIQIYLPDKAGFQVDARARNGEIESDFSDLRTSNENDEGTASGNVSGGGPHLVLNNEHGGIEIRKSSSSPDPEISMPKIPRMPHVPSPPKVPQPTEN
jgi:DUF4097 and DUF4098 domain-containing protein YvlB